MDTPYSRGVEDEHGFFYTSLRQYEEEAERQMAESQKHIKGYWGVYADNREVIHRSRAAFDGLYFESKCLTGFGVPDMTTEIYGEKVTPLGVSPSAFHKLAHESGELGTAKGVGAMGGIYCYNFYYANVAIEEVAKAPGAKWLHLYVHSGKESLRDAFKKMEAVGGFSAIVVTMDHPHNRVKDESKPPFLKAECYIPMQTPNGSDDFDVSMSTWEDFAWICKNSALPVVAKGIMSVGDAKKAVAHGAKGIFVSAHGGRQFAYAASPLEVLPDIIDAVGGAVKGNVFIDTGIRTGGEALKALCLGAKAVFVGRPALHGLRLKGEDGVFSVMNILKYQLECNMQCTGFRSISEISPSAFSVIEGPVAKSMERRRRRRHRRMAFVAVALGVAAGVAWKMRK